MRSSRLAPSKRGTIGGIILALVVIAIAAWAVYNFVPGVKPVNPHDITNAQLQQVQAGMTIDQVEAILHHRIPTELKDVTDQPGVAAEGVWWNPGLQSAANVWFGSDGTVVDKDGFNLP
jgi:hypothetical protein